MTDPIAAPVSDRAGSLAGPTRLTEGMALADVKAALDVATAAAFVAETSARRRDPHQLSMSKLGGCVRQSAYRIAGYPVSDIVEPGEGRAANMGTAIHLVMLPRLRDQFDGALIERPVVLHAAGLSIPGSIDFSVPHVLLLDWKTCGAWRTQQILLNGIADDHLVQVSGYGTALRQEQETPETIGVSYVDRSTGDEVSLVERFTNRHMMMIIQLVERLVDWADTPDEAPRENAAGEPMRGPGSWTCDECPWLKACWGENAVPGRILAEELDDPEVEELLVEYAALTPMETSAKNRKKEIVAKLEASQVRYRQYGRAKYSRGLPSEVEDPYAALARLKGLGYPAPTHVRQGPVRITLVQPPKTKKKKKPSP